MFFEAIAATAGVTWTEQRYYDHKEPWLFKFVQNCWMLLKNQVERQLTFDLSKTATLDLTHSGATSAFKKFNVSSMVSVNQETSAQSVPKTRNKIKSSVVSIKATPVNPQNYFRDVNQLQPSGFTIGDVIAPICEAPTFIQNPILMLPVNPGGQPITTRKSNNARFTETAPGATTDNLFSVSFTNVGTQPAIVDGETLLQGETVIYSGYFDEFAREMVRLPSINYVADINSAIRIVEQD